VVDRSRAIFNDIYLFSLLHTVQSLLYSAWASLVFLDKINYKRKQEVFAYKFVNVDSKLSSLPVSGLQIWKWSIALQSFFLSFFFFFQSSTLHEFNYKNSTIHFGHSNVSEVMVRYFKLIFLYFHIILIY